MQLIASWKHSLQLLKWENLKRFVNAVFTAVPRIYRHWIKYGFLSFALIVACILLIEKFGYVPYSEQLFVVIVSLLSGYAFMALYILVKEGLNNQSIALTKYKKHAKVGIVALALVVGALLFSLTPLYGIWHYRFERFQEIILSGKSLPEWAYGYMQIKPSHIATIFSVLLLFIQGVMLHASFVMFFFLDSAGSIVDLLKSVIKAIRFIIFNLPILIITYALVMGVLFVLQSIINLSVIAASNAYVLTLRLLFGVIFYTPLFVIINGQLYKQYK